MIFMSEIECASNEASLRRKATGRCILRRMHAPWLAAILASRGIVGVVVGPRPAQPKPDLLDLTQFSVATVGVPLPEVQLQRTGSQHARR